MPFGLARFDLNAITRRIELPEISPDPSKPWTLVVRYAGEGNKAWTNALFLLPKGPENEAPTDTSDRFALATAGTVIVGWENVLEDSEPVEFSAEACKRFVAEMRQCAPDIWRRRVDNFVADIKNFREAPPAVDPVDLGKEPPRG